MIELLRYYPAYFLECAWLSADQFLMERDHTPGHCVKIVPTGPVGRKLLGMIGTEKDLCTTAMAQKSLGLFMKDGPVIIRPSMNLCHALLDTEIKMNVTDYKMPFPIMGVELPEELIKPHYPSLMLIWKPFDDIVYCWTLSPSLCTYYELFGTDMLMEDRLLKAEACDDESEYNLQVLGGRVALNLCMLAAHRPTNITPLAPRTIKHRRARDPKLQLLAARECQELTIRDLFLRPHTTETIQRRGEGQTQVKHRRRGHWKRVPYGERAQLRKWMWLNSYWTHPEIPIPDEGGGTIYLK